jgi:hypothetical protein
MSFLLKKSRTLVSMNFYFFKFQVNNTLKLPVGVSPLQLVNLHRNRRYFVIKLHTWFCLSYFLKTSIAFYCIYQYFFLFHADAANRKQTVNIATRGTMWSDYTSQMLSSSNQCNQSIIIVFFKFPLTRTWQKQTWNLNW